MSYLKLVSAFLGIAGLVLGLYAAALWNNASKVVVKPTFLKYDGIAPLDLDMANAHWIAGLNEYVTESGDLNRKAAAWTAVAVLCSSLSGFAGMLG